MYEDYDYDDPGLAAQQRRRNEAEYERGKREVEEAQAAGPPGSAAREAAYLEMEQRRMREGDD